MSNANLNLNPNLPLCWDCFRIDEDRRDISEEFEWYRRDISEEFEWEEIDGGLEEREVINIDNRALDDDDDNENGRVSIVDWEFLWMNHLDGTSDDAESYLDEGFVYTTSEQDELMFSQFHEHHGSLLKGSPPAARSAVARLPSVVLTKEDAESNSSSFISCAICKDEIMVEEEAKRLPCLHCYHEECILPWLEMKNTCPLCRYELPTDDPDYERRKARRARNAGGLEVVEDEMVRYDFEILPEA